MGADFSGYATKVGLKCSDGRTIMPDAFKHQDGETVPLVWQHGHNDPKNILGHAVLENRDDGVYCYAFCNNTESGKNSKDLVHHKDIKYFSIYANKLIEKGKAVYHGSIKEVSLVLSGANPGALIDNVSIAHSDGDIETLEDEAIIYTGLVIQHDDSDEEEEPEMEHADTELTVQAVIDSMSEEQRNVLNFMVGTALQSASEGGSAQQSDEQENEEVLTHQEGSEMSRNVFDQTDKDEKSGGSSLTHDQMRTILDDAQKMGSLKESVIKHAGTWGINNIDLLFPDAQALEKTPEWITRRMEWVSGVLTGTRHSPFSRIKSMSADITHEEARAKGYIKGNLKKEQFFGIAARVTTPQTVYKKQRLDRDDIIDITDFDVVGWLKAEMRVMLDEEIARAVLIGDGRDVADLDKIQEDKVRPIARDDEFYSHQTAVAPTLIGNDLVDEIIRQREFYLGSGNPAMYCTTRFMTDLLLSKDNDGHRFYKTEAELAAALRVSKIVEVPVMEDQTVIDVGDGVTVHNLLAVLVNLSDYTIGADKGGAIATFDDFDIDYNQYKYLIETRLSGCLTKHKSAQIICQRTA